MKKIITIAVFVLAFAAMTGFASAATFTEIVQPAGAIYNENVDINGQLKVSSLVVGETGIGGVTYFNGTIVNVGKYTPVTFGDDVRIDGALFRGPTMGMADGQGLKIADYLYPTWSNKYDLGMPFQRWRDIYMSGKLYGEDVIVGREIWGGSHKGVNNDDPLFVSDTMVPTLDDINDLGNNNNRWRDLYLSGNLSGETGTFNGALTVNGVTGLTLADMPAGIASGAYLPLAGGTLTGGLTVSGVTGLVAGDIPTDIVADNYLQLTGGTLTGPGNLIMDGDLTIAGVIDYPVDLEFDGGYASGGVTFMADGSILSGWNIATTNNAIIDGELYVGGGYSGSGATIEVGGNIKTKKDLTVDKNSYFAGGMNSDGVTILETGDVYQSTENFGIVKHTLVVTHDGLITRGGGLNHIPSVLPTITHTGTGIYTIDFGYQVQDRYALVTPMVEGLFASIPFSMIDYISPNVITVYMSDITGTPTDQGFTLVLF